MLSFKQPHFHQARSSSARCSCSCWCSISRVTRFWCRAICPLGALLGVCSRWSLVQMRKHEEKCDDCRRCLLHCQGGDDPIPGATWRKAECHLCLNCLSDCPTGGISFAWSTSPSPAKQTRETPELKRRALLTSLAAGAAMVPLLRSGPGLKDAGRHPPHPPAGLAGRVALPRPLHPLRRLHEGVPEQRPAPGARSKAASRASGRRCWCRASATASPTACSARRSAPPAPSGRSRWRRRRVRAGLGARDSGLGSRQQSRPARDTDRVAATTPPTARNDPIRIGTAFYDRGRCLPWAHGHRVHRLRGVVPDVAEGHLPRAGRGRRRPGADEDREAAVRRSEALHRLRRVRVRVPGQGQPGDLRHQRRRDPLEDQPVPAPRKPAPAEASS